MNWRILALIMIALSKSIMQDNILLNKKVLVAEDNTINQMVVKHTLTKLGAIPDIAADGQEAVEKMKLNRYDLILMDIQMPLLDGYDTTKFIRNQLQSNIPIIAMTAFALKGEDDKCIECGMNGYVSKPFTIESLRAAIQSVLEVPVAATTNPYILSTSNVAVDIGMLYEIAGDDSAYINTMITTFLENMPKTLAKIEADLAAEDWDNLYRSAHYAKSSLSVIKISDTIDWVQKIEERAKAKHDVETIPALLNRLKENYAIGEKLLLQKFGNACVTQMV